MSTGRSYLSSTFGSKEGVDRLWEKRYWSNLAVFSAMAEANSTILVVVIVVAIRQQSDDRCRLASH